MIDCKCGKAWDKREVKNDQTIHTIDSYRYKFTGRFSTNPEGYTIVEKINSCPNC